MMKNKILYIGLTEDPKITPIKKSYKRELSGFGYGYGNPPWNNHITYIDQKYQRQFRFETWEKVERNAYRITLMNFIENNTFEGEQISIMWD